MNQHAAQVTAKAVLTSAVFTVLMACAHDPHAVVVVDANDLKVDQATQQYSVQKGDTLYSIAFRFGTTVYALARRNGLSEPYVIYTGQALSVNNTQPVARPTQPLKNVKTTEPKPQVRAPALRVPASSPVKKVATRRGSFDQNWILPTNGVIGKRFSEGKIIHKGVNFLAAKGSPVLAARAGKVVYAGNGLKAYGLLIIIKHDQQYLSASAYNEKLLVKEGDTVKQGQKIATVGKKGNESMLHFEIRQNGKPINPLLLLPSVK